MIIERIQGKLLRDFLRAARVRLQPEDIGVKSAPNRRGTGLHQADLAEAMIVSDRWYNGFENGACRTVRTSQLDKLADLLSLSQAERVCMYLLAVGHEPAPSWPPSPDETTAFRAVMTRLVDLIGPSLPAMLCDIAWNILAWNPAMAERIDGFRHGQAETPNVILWLFGDEAARMLGDIERAREVGIGLVQLAVARYPADPVLRDLVARILRLPAARHMWNRWRISDELTISSQPLMIQGSMHETDLVTLDVPGRLRLVLVVPRS